MINMILTIYLSAMLFFFFIFRLYLPKVERGIKVPELTFLSFVLALFWPIAWLIIIFDNISYYYDKRRKLKDKRGPA